jgi:hypothetical protein
VASNGKKENILTSWKEIAAYLDRDVRTCVRWEKRYGLPVHRLERDSKAKVFAYKQQIDQWLAERSALASQPSVCELPLRRRFRPFPVLFALAGLAAAAYFLFIRPGGASETVVPSDFHIRGSALVVVDGRGRELWSYDTRLPDLETEDVFRAHSANKMPGPDYVPVWPYLLIRDIDGDDRMEVLFSTQTHSEDGEGTLFCFDERGTERWRFDAGRALEFGGRPYRREYRIFGFNVDDYDGDGAAEVLVISHHKPDWPCQTVLLDASGRSEGEYWNAGYFMDASAGDVDGDGTKELVLSGVNNEYRRGCVIVFDAGGLRGGSPQAADAFRASDIGEGGQAAYILFPKSDVHAAIRLAGDPINYFWIHEGDGLTAVTTETQLYFDLDRSLACRDLTLSNHFQSLHEGFAQAGKVRSVLDESYRRSLMDSLLYYRAGDWAGGPEIGRAETARLNKGSRRP